MTPLIGETEDERVDLKSKIRNLKSKMKPLRVDIITIFPDYFRAVFDYGIIRRARAAGLVTIEAHDLRAWTSDKHHVVDDRPFGGGDGMVMKPEPIFAAVKSLTGANRRETVPPGTRVVLLSPQGQTLTQASAAEFAKCEHVILICGRYEGVDERVGDAVVTDEISIGDYVLSAVTESFSDGMLDYPHYTRPPEFEGMRVPEVLLTGNHAEIARWRREAALEKTKRNRPDLLK